MHQQSRIFERRRPALLEARRVRQREIGAGAMPDFLAETTHIRQSEWKVAPLRARLTRPPGRDYGGRWTGK